MFYLLDGENRYMVLPSALILLNPLQPSPGDKHVLKNSQGQLLLAQYKHLNFHTSMMMIN